MVNHVVQWMDIQLAAGMDIGLVGVLDSSLADGTAYLKGPKSDAGLAAPKEMSLALHLVVETVLNQVVSKVELTAYTMAAEMENA